MIKQIEKKRFSWPFRLLVSFIIPVFSLNLIILPPKAQAQTVVTPSGVAGLNLPIPGTMVPLSDAFTPTIVRGMTIHPENPLQFDFIIDTGNEGLEGEVFNAEAKKLVKYFLATLTVPDDEQWVNLSPYEKDRIVPESFGRTVMGRDLLAQDYVLKQLTASIMYPEGDLGQEFWDRVYTKANELFGTSQIPMNTFNKIWIVPSKAVVYEHGNSVFVVENHLKVMLEEDYVAFQSNLGIEKYGLDSMTEDDTEIASGISSEVVREVLIPAIEEEVNKGKNFANLRQIYNSMLLATWYKRNLKESLLEQVYVDKNKVKGVDVKDKQVKQKIYDQYIEAFKKGVYNYIREDYDPETQEYIPRKYFSGGMINGYGKIHSYNDNDAPAIVREMKKVAGSPVNKDFKVFVNFAAIPISSSGLLPKVTQLPELGEVSYGITYTAGDDGNIYFKNDGSTKTGDGKMILLRPIPFLPWANEHVTNPAGIKIGSKSYLGFRAVGTISHQEGYKWPISRIGMAVSDSDFEKGGMVLSEPMLLPLEDYEIGSVEDARFRRGFWRNDGFHPDDKDGDTIAVFYSALSYTRDDAKKEIIRAAMATINLDDFQNYRWEKLVRRGVLNPSGAYHDRNVEIAPKPYIVNGEEVYVLMDRPWKDDESGGAIKLLYFPVGEGIRYQNIRDSEEDRKEGDVLLAPSKESDWYSFKVGMGAYVGETADAYVYLFHGVKEAAGDTPRGYRAGLLAVSKDDPKKITFISQNPVIEITAPFENEGAWVPNVIFPTGFIPEKAGALKGMIVYGAGDHVIGMKKMDVAREIGGSPMKKTSKKSPWRREYLAQGGLRPPDWMGLELAFNPTIGKISQGEFGFQKNTYFIIYRGIRKDGSDRIEGVKKDNSTNFYMAISYDGIHVDKWIIKPILVKGTTDEELTSIEDPRLVRGRMDGEKFIPDLKGETLAMFYVGYNSKGRQQYIDKRGELRDEQGFAQPLWASIPVTALAQGKYDQWKRHGTVSAVIKNKDEDITRLTWNKDMILFPEPVFIKTKENGQKKVIMFIDRPMHDHRQLNIRLSWVDAEKGFTTPWQPDGERIILAGQPGTWKGSVGAGAAPVKTDRGWIFPYHGTEYIENVFTYNIDQIQKREGNFEGELSAAIKAKRIWEEETEIAKAELEKLKLKPDDDREKQEAQKRLQTQLDKAKRRVYRTGELLLDINNVFNIKEDNGPSLEPNAPYDYNQANGKVDGLKHVFNDGMVILLDGRLAVWTGNGDQTIDVVTAELAKLFPSPEEKETAGSPVATNQLGGINLNPAALDLQIKRDANGDPLPVFQQPIMDMKIDGFLPVIINVAPINAVMLLGLIGDGEDDSLKK